MATRGPKPKPTKLKVVGGTARPDRVNTDEPQIEPDIPECPDHLDAEAVKEWNRIAPILLEAGLLTQVDRAALALYCQTWGRLVEAEENLKQTGLVVKTKNSDFPIQSPFLSIANKAMDQCIKMLGEFGLTPSSRARVKATKTASSDPFEDFLNDKKRGP